jgi:N-acetylmuramoyl-L-alanine amidase
MKTRWLAASVLATCLGIEADSEAGPQLSQAPATAAAGLSTTSRLRVVIDPGHGGTNTGARGAEDGVLEKRVTLAVAKQLAAELRAAGLEVSLTRQVDRTLTLRQRAVLANRDGADLFVSIHANASPTRSQRGFETYVLTPAGVDVIAPALRNEEPSPRPGVAPAISGILDDVERGAAQWEAADLAAAVQASLRAVRGRDHDRGVRQDAHHVLLGAIMPAVLVEIGFVDHPIEGPELVEHATQADIARAIAKAVISQASSSSSI